MPFSLFFILADPRPPLRGDQEQPEPSVAAIHHIGPAAVRGEDVCYA